MSMWVLEVLPLISLTGILVKQLLEFKIRGDNDFGAFELYAAVTKVSQECGFSEPGGG